MMKPAQEVGVADAVSAHRLSRLLSPRSIAVIGGTWAEAVVAQNVQSGFDGAVWPVNPKRSKMAGIACYADLTSLPGAPDVAFVGVNREAAVDVVAQLSAMGCGAAVVFASGFAEAGEVGAQLQQRLLEAAGNMPILGPNCYGLLNAVSGACLWPDVHGLTIIERGIGIAAQSSNIALNLTFSRRGTDIAKVVCLGNQGGVGLAALVDAFVDDPDISVIALYIEGIIDADALSGALKRAEQAGKAVIAYKAGRSEAAQQIAQSHTASLAGADEVMRAWLTHHGVWLVDTMTDFLETAKFLHAFPALKGAGVVSLSCSGGEAGLMADAAARHTVPLYGFPEDHTQAIRETVNPLVTVSNPLDYHTFDWGYAERLEATFAAVMNGHQDLSVLVIDEPPPGIEPRIGWDISVQAFIDAAAKTGKPAAILATLPECMSDQRLEQIKQAGLLPMLGEDHFMRACAAAYWLGNRSASPTGIMSEPVRTLVPLTPDAFTEAGAKAVLAKAGMSIPRGRICDTVDDARNCVRQWGRCAFKVHSNTLQHKTEIDGVRLGIATDDQAIAAFEALKPLGEAVLVEEMIDRAVIELLLGARYDPQIGWTMVLGQGGVLTEVHQDTALLMLPLSEKTIVGALQSLRIWPLFEGFRGKPAARLSSVIDACFKLEGIIAQHGDGLAEIDINPVIVTSEQAWVVDALFVPRAAPAANRDNALRQTAN